ncbi:ribonuclease P protein component [Nibrella viscosa]|uniref:Ribonuclease P protein component n=1 Tax=Nibrella viscosa TaxID=1084524 RepID=A0ABP8KV84_9BACT
MRQTLTKAERLSSRKIIDRLFEKGSTDVKTFYLFPFRVLYLYASTPSVAAQPAVDTSLLSQESVQSFPPLPAILITVSKRNFKKAVDRNLIRRRIREAYRKNKAIMIDAAGPEKQLPAYITFLYTARDKISFEEIEKSMKLALKRVGRGQ